MTRNEILTKAPNGPWSISEVATLLRRDARTLRDAVDAGALPCNRFGVRYSFVRAHLVVFLGGDNIATTYLSPDVEAAPHATD